MTFEQILLYLEYLKKEEILSKNQLIGLRSLGVSPILVGRPLGKGKKKREIIHFWWISVLPLPLIHLGEINNIHIKEFFLSTYADHPPLPLSTFIKINNIFSSSSI